MIVLAVHRLIHIVGKLGDAHGVAARIEAIAVIREQQRAYALFENIVKAGGRALHLIVNDAVYIGLAVLIELKAPALLTEGVGIYHAAGRKDRVEIYLRKIEVIAHVAGGNGIDRLIGERHRVEEGVHRALDQIDEGLLHGVLFGAAEHRMLKDVENARGILGQGLEAHAEELVGIAVIDPAKLGADLFVTHLNEIAAELRGFADALHAEALNYRTDFDFQGDILLGFIFSLVYHSLFAAVCQQPILRPQIFCCNSINYC